jgi:AGZA family xanthine/uracil permease-like MFS transporter
MRKGGETMRLRITGGDVNAFWALAADNLANLIIISGVCTGLFHMPADIVFGRILPGLGMALLVGLSYYGYMAIRLGRREGREDVTALPYGVSTPVLFVYLFAVIGPVYFKTHDPLVAWQVGMAAAFIGGIIEASGSLIGPWIKRVTPRAAMLGTLGGIAIVWIATVPFAEIFEHPVVGFISLAIILAGLVARVSLPWGMPAGLVAIIIGSAIGFFTGDASWDLSGLGFYAPRFVFSDLFAGLGQIFSNPWITMWFFQ